jgi:hypothetical protein
MAITIKDYLNKAKFVRNNILDEQERIILKNKRKIVNLNINQIENSLGNDDKLLKNSNSKFKGVYTMATQIINPSKIAGNPYNFFQTGNFLHNFELSISDNSSKIDIFSTGTGVDLKANFFKGYTNMFGLNKEHQNELNNQIILPELQLFVKKYL